MRSWDLRFLKAQKESNHLMPNILQPSNMNNSNTVNINLGMKKKLSNSVVDIGGKQKH
jgi:hypothetical protein